MFGFVYFKATRPLSKELSISSSVAQSFSDITAEAVTVFKHDHVIATLDFGPFVSSYFHTVRNADMLGSENCSGCAQVMGQHPAAFGFVHWGAEGIRNASVHNAKNILDGSDHVISFAKEHHIFSASQDSCRDLSLLQVEA